MANTNIKLFDESKSNMMSDADYGENTQRTSGVQTGVASSQLQNKFQYQVSLMAYAVAQLMIANGYDAMDSAAVSTFVGNFSNSVVQKVKDKASASEAAAGTNDLKWISAKQLVDVATSIANAAAASVTDTANSALSKANAASTAAASATETANAASESASAASNTATSALDKANTAISTANTAKSTADAAKSTADAASSTAASANTKAEGRIPKLTSGSGNFATIASDGTLSNSGVNSNSFAASRLYPVVSGWDGTSLYLTSWW